LPAPAHYDWQFPTTTPPAPVPTFMPRALAGAFMPCLVYGVLVIIFRYAFHVELWNPFR
jgi:hypothetical protein